MNNVTEEYTAYGKYFQTNRRDTMCMVPLVNNVKSILLRRNKRSKELLIEGLPGNKKRE